MLQSPCKTLGYKKNMVYKIPPEGGGGVSSQCPISFQSITFKWIHYFHSSLTEVLSIIKYRLCCKVEVIRRMAVEILVVL